MIFITCQNRTIRIPEDDADALKHVEEVTLYTFNVFFDRISLCITIT
jgi:hypothetical protein